MSDSPPAIAPAARRPSRFSGWAATLLLLLCVLGGAFGGYRYAMPSAGPQLYEATAVIFTPRSGGDLRDPMSVVDVSSGNHARMFKSLVIAERAAEKFGLKDLSIFRGKSVQEIATEAAAGMRATRPDSDLDPETQLVELRFRAENGADAAAVVRAMIAAYDEFWEETRADAFGGADKLLFQAKDELGAELKKKRDELRKFSKEMPAGGPDLVENIRNISTQMEKGETERKEAEQQRNHLQAAHERILAAKQKQESPATIAALLRESLSAHEPRIFFDRSGNPMPVQPDPQGPKVNGAAKPKEELPADEDKAIDRMMLFMEARLKSLASAIKEYAELRQRGQADLQYLMDFKARYEELQAEIQRISDVHLAVLDRAKQIDLVSGARRKTVVLDPAFETHPAEPDPRPFPAVPVGAGATIGLLVGLSLLAIRSALYPG